MTYTKIIRPLAIGTILAALVFLSYARGLLDFPELKSLDIRFQIRGAIPPQLPIVLVNIDQDSFDELGFPWPWPRTIHAELIRKLAPSQAKLIAFDVLFTEPKPDPAEDQELSEAIREAGNVILAAEYTVVPSDFGPKESMSLPIPLLREHALGYGPVNLITDPDGVVRSAHLALPFQGRIYPSFAYQISRGLTGQAGLQGRDISPVAHLINFSGPPRSYPVVPYYRILNDEIELSLFQDKAVLVGAFAPSLHDLFPTPFSASKPMAGVEIQANFAETLVANDPIIPVRGWGHAAIFLFLCVVAIWGSIHFKPLPAFALVLVLSGVFIFAILYLFSHYQLWVPLVAPLLGIVLSYGGITTDNYIREQKERMRVRAMFGKYVSPDVMEEILENREGLALGGKRRHITVLFSDIRGFTSISEQLGPEQVVAFLGDYLPQAARIVFKHGGTVDKFIGDAVMAIFGSPKTYGDDARRAVQTGIELIELIKVVAPKWSTVIGRPMKVGVGVNSGDAVVGSIGAEIRADFTAIGDTVNLASRLEGLTKELGVSMLVSETTAAEMQDSIALTPVRRIKVIGRETPLLVYTPDSLLDPEVEIPKDLDEPYVQQHK
ncbi:MAG: adenylate/guanylate cyclase domain-containing protein [Nitrospinae bacterium]|nr:adenylate/guanylate cyclase domain-containing protein [Nitrospinota bacterium]